MKKLIFLSFSFLSFCFIQLNAQPSDPFSAYTNGIFNGSSIIITRTDLTGAYHVALFSTGDTSYFVLCDIEENEYSYAAIPVQWKVLDFQIQSKKIVFCGENIATGKALLGSFDFDDLLQDQGGAVTYMYNATSIDSLTSLYRLAVSTLMGGINVMAIGRSDGIDPTVYGANKVLYLDDITFGSAAILYSYLVSMPTIETFWNVVATDNYFVTLATTRYQSDSLVIRYFSNDMFISKIKNNDIHAPYQYYIYSADNFKRGFHTVETTLDTIVLATTNYNGDNQISFYTIIASAMMPNTWQNVYYTKQTFSGIESGKVYDMVYVPDINRVAISYSTNDTTMTITNNNETAIPIDPPLPHPDTTYSIKACYPIIYLKPSMTSNYDANRHKHSAYNEPFTALTSNYNVLYAVNDKMWYYRTDEGDTFESPCIENSQQRVTYHSRQLADSKKDGEWIITTFSYGIETSYIEKQILEKICE